MLVICFTRDIFGNKIHGAGSVQRNTGNDVLQILRFQFLHEALHPRTFQLEDSLRFAASDQCQHLWIIIVYIVDVDILPGGLLDKFHRIPDHRQGPQP